MSLQFPPSSPLAHADHDPFKGVSRGRNEYPTPNPSSTIGRLSSPVPHENEEDVLDAAVAAKSAPETVSINRDFNILNPTEGILRVPLLPSKKTILVGRSSKTCDFFLPTKDKTISRAHIRVTHTSEKMVLTCLGYNGLVVRVPRACMVYGCPSSNTYILQETDTPLDALLMECKLRTVKLDNSHTEFAVNRTESVQIPRVFNVLVEIRGHLVLINPQDDDEELTDDEVPVLKKTGHRLNELQADLHTPVSSRMLDFKGTPPTKAVFKFSPEEPTPSRESRSSVSSEPVENTSQEKENDAVAPITVPEIKIAETTAVTTPQMAQDSQFSQPESVLHPKPAFAIFEDKPQPISRAMTPPVPRNALTDKTNSLSVTPKRKASSEEPPASRPMPLPAQKKKKKTSPLQTVEIDQSSIENLSNVPEINNILINHLAFLRLSLTPASFLNTILVVVSKISLVQLRCILNNIECVGVIYRQGKDAAGKPLEEEYYYVPEKDNDSERPGLVSTIKGHGGLRSCRRVHKQYYWKKPAPIKKKD